MRLLTWPSAVLIIDHIRVFVIHAVLAAQVSVSARQILMAVPDELSVMSRTPDHDADCQCATSHHRKSNK